MMEKKNRKLNRLLRSVSRRRRGTEGMTLVEIMIVVIIMALIATAVGVAVLPRLEKARIDSTETSAQQIRSAVTMYLAENPAGGCPNTEDLVTGGFLDEDKSISDAWDGEFEIECDGTRISVVSAGPDKQFGTEDDID